MKTTDPDVGAQDPFAAFGVGPNASIHLANGNLSFIAPLFSCDGAGLTTGLSLNHNSLSFSGSLISQGWQHNYDVVLTDHMKIQFLDTIKYGSWMDCPDFISVRFGDGRVVEFKHDNRSAGYHYYVAANEPADVEGRLGKYGHFSKVEKNTASRNLTGVTPAYLLTAVSGLEYHFDENGRLIRMVDSNGNKMTLEYEVAGASQEGNPLNRLKKVVDYPTANPSTGRETAFDYTAATSFYPAGQLNKITDPQARTYTLAYAGADPAALSTARYDAACSDPSNPTKPDTWTFLHHAANDANLGMRVNLLAEVRTPRGTLGTYGTKYRYYQDNRFAESEDPEEVIVPDGSTTPGAAIKKRQVTYWNPYPEGAIGDREYWRAYFKNRRAYTTTVDYQYFRSIATRVEDPLGFYVKRTFDAEFRNVLSFRDKNGNVTDFTYATDTVHVKDNVETIKRPGSPTRPVVTYDYSCESGKILIRTKSVTNPLSQTTTYDIEAGAGNLKKITYPMVTGVGQTTIDYTYDSRGRVKTEKLCGEGARTTIYSYDLIEGYDAGLVTSIQRPGVAKKERFAYTKMGVRWKHWLPENANPTQTNVDGRDRVIEVIDPTNATSKTAYDPDSNVREAKDPRQVAGESAGQTTYLYDKLNRRKETKDALPHSVYQYYDANGSPRIAKETSIVNGSSKTVQAYNAYDARDLLAREESESGTSDPALVKTYDTYDGNGNLTKMAFAGRVTEFVYDVRNNRTRTVYPQVQAKDAAGNTINVFPIDTYCYNLNDLAVLVQNRVVKTGDPKTVDGVLVSGVFCDYDELDRVKGHRELTDNPGMVCVPAPSISGGIKTAYTFDVYGNRTVAKLAEGTAYELETLAEHDLDDRLNKITGPSARAGRAETKVDRTDNDVPSALWVDQPNGGGLIKACTITSTPRLQLDSIADIFGNTTRNFYDKCGNRVTQNDPAEHPFINEYDNLNRVSISKTNVTSNGVSQEVKYAYAYNEDGTLKEIADPRLNKYTFWYDGLGRRTRMIYPAVGTSTPNEIWTYDNCGRVRTRVDGNNTTTTYDYDTHDRVTKATYTVAGSTLLTVNRQYDENGRLKSIDDGAIRIGYEYTTQSDKSPDPTPVPVPMGLVKKSTWEMYNSANQTWTSFKSVEYKYDSHGRRREVKEPEGAVVRYIYDADRLWKITRQEPGQGETLYVEHTYDKGGRLIATHNAKNQTSRAYRYDLAGRLKNSDLVKDADGSLLSAVGYDYDSRGNRTRVYYEHLALYVDYAYDEMSRLTGESTPGNYNGSVGTPPPYTNQYVSRAPGNVGLPSAVEAGSARTPPIAVAGYSATYRYDAAGNREYKSDTRLGSSTCLYDAQNKLTDETGNLPNGQAFRYKYLYDFNGNMTKRFEADSGGSQILTKPVNVYGYDLLNRMNVYRLEANGNPSPPITTSAVYQYTPTGDRAMKTVNGATTAFMYDGDDVVADYDVPVTGPYTYRRSYVQGNGIDSKFAQVEAGGENIFYDTDALGSVNQIVDAAGIVQETHLRTAWGEDIVGSTGLTRYGFTQREVDDESGLMYYRARHYSPRLGRFVQNDPILSNRTSKHYSYCSNNPALYIDPFGLEDNPSPSSQQSPEQYPLTLRKRMLQLYEEETYNSNKRLITVKPQIINLGGDHSFFYRKIGDKYYTTEVKTPYPAGFPKAGQLYWDWDYKRELTQRELDIVLIPFGVPENTVLGDIVKFGQEWLAPLNVGTLRQMYMQEASVNEFALYGATGVAAHYLGGKIVRFGGKVFRKVGEELIEVAANTIIKQMTAKGFGKVTLSVGNSEYGLTHILINHVFARGGKRVADKSMFPRGIAAHQLNAVIKEVVEEGAINEAASKYGNKSLEKVVNKYGINKTVRVVIDPTGNVVTAFPLK